MRARAGQACPARAASGRTWNGRERSSTSSCGCTGRCGPDRLLASPPMAASKGSVLVAMSGGVDSSVSACLLAEQGYEVLGSHMKLVHLDGVDHGCCGPQAEADAAEVARIAGFKFEVADMSATFADTVLADFFDEHEAGRTPNPCVRCNEQIKFGSFLARA